MEGEDFNPRVAALRYAAEVVIIGGGEKSPEGGRWAAAVNALACGLVYVGDEIKELRLLLRDALPMARGG